MKPLRNGDLQDAAELIDSAQGCAKLMAECCAEKDDEIARLREAIKREAEMHASIQGGGACACKICEIAREGR